MWKLNLFANYFHQPNKCSISVRVQHFLWFQPSKIKRVFSRLSANKTQEQKLCGGPKWCPIKTNSRVVIIITIIIIIAQLSLSFGSLQHDAYLECTSAFWICFFPSGTNFPSRVKALTPGKIEHSAAQKLLLSGRICFAICQHHLKAFFFPSFWALLFSNYSFHSTFFCVGGRCGGMGAGRCGSVSD